MLISLTNLRTPREAAIVAATARRSSITAAKLLDYAGETSRSSGNGRGCVTRAGIEGQHASGSCRRPVHHVQETIHRRILVSMPADSGNISAGDVRPDRRPR